MLCIQSCNKYVMFIGVFIESYIWKDWGLNGHWGLYDKRLRFIWLLRVIYEKTEVWIVIEVYMIKDWGLYGYWELYMKRLIFSMIIFNILGV